MMKLEPANIVCPICRNGNYMYHLIGKNIGYLNMKCINCNSYFNFDELYKWRIGEVLNSKPITNANRIRSMTDEELADYLRWHNDLYSRNGMDWLDWLKQEATE